MSDSPSTNKGLPKATTFFDTDGTSAFVAKTDAYDVMGRPLSTSLTVPAGWAGRVC